MRWASRMTEFLVGLLILAVTILIFVAIAAAVVITVSLATRAFLELRGRR